MANHHGNNFMDLSAQSNARIPPSWGPEQDSHYPYRYYEQDIRLWASATDIDQLRQGPVCALRLTGAARTLIREMTPDALTNGLPERDDAGRVIVDQFGAPVMRTGVETLLYTLNKRYGMLDQEIQISALSDLMTFHRQSTEDTDQMLARFEVILHRAITLANTDFEAPIKAWMILTHLKLPKDRWPTILAPTEGRLPIGVQEYNAFTQYVRRNGHLYDRHADPHKTIQQPYYFGPRDAPDIPEQSFGDLGIGSPAYFGGPPSDSTFADDDFVSVSSGWSMEEHDLDWEDIKQLNDNEAGEQLYLAYRHAKRKWRKFSGPRRKRFGHKQGSGTWKPTHGHGRHQKGKASNFLASELQVSTCWVVIPEEIAYFKGGKSGGKGGKRPFVRSGNPMNKDGTQMRCSTCNSTEHFRAMCPEGKGKGKGSSAPSNSFVSSQTCMTSTPISSVSSNSQASTRKSGFFVGSVQQTELQPLVETTQELGRIMFADGTFMNIDPDAPDSSSFQVVQRASKRQFFPWYEYHANVRPTQGEGLVVDTGAVHNLSGDGWLQRVTSLAQAAGHGVTTTALKRSIEVEGVGKGADSCNIKATVPLAMPNNVTGSYTANILNNSPVPALLGLEGMESNRMVLDPTNLKAYLIGPGGYSLNLSPNSHVIDLIKSPSGHILIPVTEWTRSGKPPSKHVTFMTQDTDDINDQQNISTQPTCEPPVENLNEAPVLRAPHLFARVFDERRMQSCDKSSDLLTIPLEQWHVDGESQKVIERHNTQTFWVAADQTGLNHKQRHGLRDRIRAFCSTQIKQNRKVLLDAGIKLLNSVKLKKLVLFTVLLAQVIAVCQPTTAESVTVEPDAAYVCFATNCTVHDKFQEDVKPSDGARELWLSTSHQHEVVKTLIAAPVTDSEIILTTDVKSKKLKKRSKPPPPDPFDDNNLGEHADNTLVHQGVFRPPVEDHWDDLGDDTSAIQLEAVEFIIHSDDSEFDDEIDEECHVFDRQYYTWACSCEFNETAYTCSSIDQLTYLLSKHQGKIDVLELFGGDGQYKLLVRRNLRPGTNWDLQCGIDLTCPKQRQQLYDYISDQAPFVILTGPPCTAMAGWSRYNRVHHPDTWAQTRAIGELLARVAAKACMMQLQGGRHFILENPWGTDIMHMPEWKAILNFSEHITIAKLDQCMKGLVDPDNKPTRKRSIILASHPVLVEDMHVECDGSHEHVHIEGSVRGISRARYAQTWPLQMVESMIKGIKKLMSVSEAYLAYPAVAPIQAEAPMQAPGAAFCPGCRAHAIRSDMRHSRVPDVCRFPHDESIDWQCQACQSHLPSTHQGHNMEVGICQWATARQRLRGGARLPNLPRDPRVPGNVMADAPAAIPDPVPPPVGDLQWQPTTDIELITLLDQHRLSQGWRTVQNDKWHIEYNGRWLRSCEPPFNALTYDLRSTYGMFTETPHDQGAWYCLEEDFAFTAPEEQAQVNARIGYPVPILIQIFSGTTIAAKNKIVQEESGPSLRSGALAAPDDIQGEPPAAEAEPDIKADWSSFDLGTALRAIKSDNHQVRVRALRRLHVRWFHCSAARMTELLRSAGVPIEALKAIQDMVDTCRVCRLWKRPSPSSVTSSRLTTKFNEVIQTDLLFYEEHVIVHIIDEATRFSLAVVVPDRTASSILTAITMWWIRILGPPSCLISDHEGALASDEGALWAEHWHITLRLTPKNSHPYMVERHHEILRSTLHRLMTHARAENLLISIEHLLSEACFAKNALVSVGGHSPYTAVLGRFPNFLLELESATSASTIDEIGTIAGTSRHATRLRELAIQSIVESTAQQRMQRAERTKTRVTGEAKELALGQQVEIWRTPVQKDSIGWRGPCTIVNLSSLEEGSIDVRWGGRTMAVRVQDIRPTVMIVLLLDSGNEPIRLIRHLLRSMPQGIITLAWVYVDTKWRLSKSANQHKAVYASCLHVAAHELGITRCLGARLGRGISFLNGLCGIETATLLWWPVSDHNRYMSWQHPGSQSIDLRILFKDDDFKDMAWCQFLSASKGEARTLRKNYRDVPSLGHDPGDDRDSAQRRRPQGGSDANMPPPSPPHAEPLRSSNHGSSHISLDDHSMPPTSGRRSLPSTLGERHDKRALSTNNTGAEQKNRRVNVSMDKRPITTDNSGPNTKHHRSGTLPDSSAAAAASAVPQQLPTATEASTLPYEDQTEVASLPSTIEYIPESDDDHLYVAWVGTAVERPLDELTKEEVSRHWNEVKEAVTKEVTDFHTLGTFVRGPRPANLKAGNVLSSRWIFKWKMKDGKKICKARLTVRGFEDKDASNLATFAGTATRWGQRIVTSIASQQKWVILTADVGSAFLRGLTFQQLSALTGEKLRQVSFMPPSGYEDFFKALPGLSDLNFATEVLVMEKPIYGLKDAPRAWRKRLHMALTEFHAICLKTDSALYVWFQGGALVCILSAHVDDLKVTGEDSFVSELLTNLERTFGKLTVHTGTFEHCGLIHEQDPTTRVITVHQNHYCARLIPVNITTIDTSDEAVRLSPEQVSLYLSLLGALSWLSQTRLDVCIYIQALQRASCTANIGNLIRLNKVCQWTKRKPMQLTYAHMPGEQFRVMNISDSAFRREDASGLAMRGAILAIMPDDPSTPGGPLHLIEWFSRRQRRITRSTFGAELNALGDSYEMSKVIAFTLAEVFHGTAMTAKQLVEMDNSGSFPLKVHCAIDCRSVFDSLAVEDTRTPTESSLIMLLLQLKEAMQSGSLSKLWWIATGDMLSDGLNKGSISRQALMRASIEGQWTLKEDVMFHEELKKPYISEEDAVRKESRYFYRLGHFL